MAKELVEKDETVQQSRALVAPTTANFLEIISRAAADPNTDVAKMNGLLDIQERMMNKQAEINFNADFHQLQMELPRITKDSKIIHKGKLIATYAKYETIDEVIRPLLVKHNFSLRYNTEPTGNKIIVTGTLSHRDGHSITDKIPLDIEGGGAKNSVQGVGSTIAYGKRYLVGMMLNLVFEGEDDDGQKASFIPMTEVQIAEIKDFLQKEQATPNEVKTFLEYMDSDSVDDISAADYDKAIIAINGWAARKRASKAAKGVTTNE